MSTTYNNANYDFKDCVAVVTGGNGGIGAAIGQRLARAGAQVVCWDLKADPASPFRQEEVDITDPASTDAAAQRLLADAGRIDFLVNNAGYAGSTVPLDEYDVAEWHRIVNVNLLGVFHTCRSVVPAMRAAGRGRIVNIASLAGKEGTPNASAYSASKAGVLALTKSLGKELANAGVLVNALAPAAVKTQLLAQMSPAHVQNMIDKSPMARLGTVDEVAEMVAWLCSGSCTFNTGAVFDLSGGRATY
ncbi:MULTISPECIES: SDR family NAD(P)-dependent oxidoreductase [unclassified Herbaspirillum]|uniref:SDR family NAD(P)-dependent oxidoreductase n=1 Tax=unclassified Herbaspirillum TaxID=2624150 RepID=UPI0011507D09|nr:MULTISPECIES: SDR family NAD(P)-dependent oxidoreductase [unclassified Herbaspirillum]MBB5392460.1 3-oxoacyl-[acyl-carrier protein] reductase [Herbaspirillum sp. SJZ102]TQK06099.1 3-oxoacyl-[acyl-carrier protein] reductase [Herbaspirillum sp. SJZ130]TQK12423.1 3-oxoacyl-[acyl-carrier protein] reductase [Herbaspirillum sp. SJZ106]